MSDFTLLEGDCLAVMKTLADNSIDAVVTDPPYHLVQNSRNGSAQPGDMETPYGRSGPSNARGFMGKQWDGGDIAFRVELWSEVLRVLKPGGHLAAFSGTRTYHRMACAIEDAGFEIRDQLAWVYGSGFPKSHDVSKGIDKAGPPQPDYLPYRGVAFTSEGPDKLPITLPASVAAKQWQGWGTALKPSWEPVCLARKPLSEPTVAANVLKWGTGAINIDACRVEGAPRTTHADGDHRQKLTSKGTKGGAWGNQEAELGACTEIYRARSGRWPANLAHDGSQEVLDLFPESKGQQGDLNETGRARPTKTCFGDMAAPKPHIARNDSGSAARFFYCAKASKTDRAGSKHPTVKPIKLMQWLCRLVTPPGGTILDPFAGSGTTAHAAILENFNSILIERETEYIIDIKNRMNIINEMYHGPEEVEEGDQNETD